MPSLAELQAEPAALFKKQTSDGTKTYERFYKDAERSGSAARKRGDHVAAAVSFARYDTYLPLPTYLTYPTAATTSLAPH